MMRRLAYLLSLLLLAACAREVVEPVWDGPVIELILDCDDLTKAGKDGTRDGDNNYHENDIDWVDFFFYPVYPDGTQIINAPKPYHYRIEDVTGSTYRINVLTNQVNNQIFPVQYDVESADVLALVNVPASLLDQQDDYSLEALYALAQRTDFESKPRIDDYGEYVVPNHRQERFMMSGIQRIELSSRTNKIVNKTSDNAHVVKLYRYASKMTVAIKAENAFPVVGTDEDGNEQTEEWEPCVDEMTIYLVDGMKMVFLDGTPTGSGGHPIPEDEDEAENYYLSYRKNALPFFAETVTGKYERIFDMDGEYYNTYPMYMYPQQWERNDARIPYLKLVLPWIRKKDNYKKEFYYKIIFPQNTQEGVPSGKNAFLRNNWYHYKIEVGMLGADTDDGSVEVNPIDFYIYYWQDKNVVIKHASIGNARYLSVDREYKEGEEEDENTFYQLNNENGIDIHYTSSHPIAYEVLSVTRPYYGSDAEGTTSFGATIRVSKGPDAANPTYADKLYPAGEYYLEYKYELGEGDAAYDAKEGTGLIATKDWFNVNAKGYALEFRHTLNNNYSDKQFDYSPYTIFLTISHADDPDVAKDYAKTVKLVQYPGVYIEGEVNSDKRERDYITDDYKNNVGHAWKNYNNNGYVFVDGDQKRRYYFKKDNNGNLVLNDYVKGLYENYIDEMKDRYGLDWNNNSNDTAGGTKTILDHNIRYWLEWLQWRTVNFTGGNRNMYNVHVTVLPSSSTFIIGDPRKTEVDNLVNEAQESGYLGDGRFVYYDEEQGKWVRIFKPKNSDSEEKPSVEVQAWLDSPHNPIVFATGQASIDGSSHSSLTNYYPTDPSSRTRNMVAPSYRVASKFGGTEYYGGNSYRAALLKCATYQEDGYPAGRWRLPTMAEINFIAMLSAKGTFVTLFSGTYWSAQGALTAGQTNTNNNQYAMTRCVYDSWYWDKLDNEKYRRLPAGDGAYPEGRNSYVLGDLPR